MSQNSSKKKIIILGAGIAGISSAYFLDKNKYDVLLFDKNDYIGGLASNFEIDGFRFDRFVHFLFSHNEAVCNEILKNAEYYSHPPKSSNYYNGFWLKHPAQNNLSPLSLYEKFRIIISFIFRKSNKNINNYSEWLDCQFGSYFANNFAKKYTKKYWCTDAKNMETKWIGQRLHCPSLLEILKGAFFNNKKEYYYAKVMRYPKSGGFFEFFKPMIEGLDIRLNKQAVKIDLANKTVEFSDNTVEYYDLLVSSIPLPKIVEIIKDVPDNIKECSEKLNYTSGYYVSLGLNKPINTQNLWFYIYDEDIPFARCYISNNKSVSNVPEGKGGIQAEIYWNKNAGKPDKEVMQKKTINSLVRMGLIKEEDIIVRNIQVQEFVNVIFDSGIYKNRETILDYLSKNNISSIGRFGKWEYFWSDQTFLDGKNAAGGINELM